MSQYKVLIAASPSFIDEELFTEKLNFLLQNRVNVQISCLTQKVFTKMVSNYCKQNNHSCNVVARDFIGDGPQTTMILYNKLMDVCDAIVVFWDNVTYNEKTLISNLRNKAHRIYTYESFSQQLEKLKVENKKRKKITIPLSKESKQRYLAAHERWFKLEYPSSYSDGFYSPCSVPVINSGSRMDFFIVNFLIWSGHTATKVAVMQKIKGMYIASGAKAGTADVTATVFKKSVKFETKHGSDKPSPEQLAMKAKEERAGGYYFFIHTIEEFFEVYDNL